MARDIYPPALSKTAKYKKITKPLLERKRRARINRCLDELKDLMVGALEIDDENISKLEKADILELTVNHLTKLHAPKDPVVEAKKFQAGFGQCAAEACRYILSVPDLDSNVSDCLIDHLSRLVSTEPLTVQVPGKRCFSPPDSPPSPQHSLPKYTSDVDRSSSDPEEDLQPDNVSRYSVSTTASYRLKSTHSTQELMSPIAGLLTTVDRISPSQYGSSENYQQNLRHPESKDEIMAKIRHHIMYKRGNEAFHKSDCTRSNEISSQERSSVIKESEYANQKRHVTETLDLRKVRSPTKPSLDGTTDHSRIPEPTVTEVKDMSSTSSESAYKKETPLDYSNLPPKKKRKLIEYQEMLKREEELRNSCETDPAWRPW